MTNSKVPQSPTGRLSQSEPEPQFFPGTPQALAQSRKLKQARAARGADAFIDLDYSHLEMRAVAATLQPEK